MASCGGRRALTLEVSNYEPLEITEDDFAEWLCFAFSPAQAEAFILLRQVHHASVAGYIFSVTDGLFSTEAADRIVEALAIPGARVTHVNAVANQ